MTLPRLETGRLVLRPWREEDAQALFAYARLPEVALPAGWKPHRSPEDSRRVIRELYAGRCLALTRREEDLPFGNIGLHNTSLCRALQALRVRELGFSMAPGAWGRGYMGEAARAVIEHAFGGCSLDALLLAHYLDNGRTAALARRLGFRALFIRGNEQFYGLYRV